MNRTTDQMMKYQKHMNNTKLGLSALGVFTFLVGMGIQAKLFPAPEEVQAAVPTVSASPSPTVDPHKTVILYSGPVRKRTPSPKPVTIEDKIRATFPEDPDLAVKIAKCESGLRANAVNKNRNGSHDYGVMQVNTIHGYSKEYLLNVDNNLKVARKLYDNRGWQPWVCFKKIKGVNTEK